jgi:hypothetical protein
MKLLSMLIKLKSISRFTGAFVIVRALFIDANNEIWTKITEMR